MGTGIKHFDYLPKYAQQIEDSLGLEPLEEKISFWRTLGLADKDGVSVGCRKIVEISLRNLMELPPSDTTKLFDLINEAFDQGIISRSIQLKCEQIRKRGNDGAHNSVKVLEAKEALELLDDFLRWFVKENFAEPDFIEPVPVNGYEDALFLMETPEEAQALLKRATIAAALSEDDEIEAEAARVQELQEEQDKKLADALATITALTDKVTELSEAFKDERDKAEQLAEAKEKALAANDRLLAEMEESREALRAQAEQVEKKVDEILAEYDYIRSLLGEGSSATPEQLDVMAFPKTKAGVKATVLKISGSAGTGKTLCLLAKLLRHVEADKATARRGDAKKALFVCFNKDLADHIDRLLGECSRDFPYAKQRIAVRSYDQLVNSLVKCNPSSDDPLRNTCADVRFSEPQWRIHYEGSPAGSARYEITREAMRETASRYQNLSNDYYLDFTSDDNVKWVAGEIVWLESNYGTPGQASGYTNMDSRLGRGGTRRPDAAIRAIILEIWEQYYILLESKKKYTIDQAAHRLLCSKELPQFDAIAVDECQDLSSLALRALYRMRKDEPGAFMYVAGDEGQKIYQRGFSWKALDQDASCYGISLKENNRNPKEIAAFASRLIGDEAQIDVDAPNILVGCWDNEAVADMVSEALGAGDTVAVIGGPLSRTKKVLPKSRNLTQLNALSAKGLEFDTVIVDYDKPLADTLEEEERLRYVHFTRPRKKLIIRCPEEVPELMRVHYPEFLHGTSEEEE